MASTDALPVPIKNQAYRVVFPILDADGDLVTGATGLDSEVSKDQGTFADCTNEATEIATSSGMYYLDLTSTEMNADCVAVIVKTSTSGAKTTPLILYPQETGDIKVDVTSFGGTAATTSGGRPDVNATHIGGSAISQASGVANVNVAQISGDSVAADNLEAAADGTGYNLGGGSVVAASVTGAVGSVTGNVGGNVTGSIGSLATQAKADVNAEADTALSDYDPPTRTELTSDTNSILSKLLRYVQLMLRKDSAIATDNATEVTAINADGGSGAGSFANTTDAQEAIRDRGDAAWTTATGFSTLDAAGVRTAVGLASANLDTQLAALPTAAENADAVWEEAIADHSGTAGSTAESLNAAGSAGDPWTTTLPGSYTGSQAGKMLSDILTDTGTTLDGKLDTVDTVVDAIKAKTDNLPAAPAATGDIPSAATVASQVRTELTTELGRIDAAVSSRLAAAGYTAPLDAAGVRSAVGLASANLDTQLGAIAGYIDTEVAAIISAIAALNNISTADVLSQVQSALTATVADSVPADGTRPSVSSGIYMLTQFLLERAVSGTTVSVKKPDGSTQLFALTLDDATSPTSITRSA